MRDFLKCIEEAGKLAWVIALLAIALWIVWGAAVWSCRFTVWMGTQAQILP